MIFHAEIAGMQCFIWAVVGQIPTRLMGKCGIETPCAARFHLLSRVILSPSFQNGYRSSTILALQEELLQAKELPKMNKPA